MDERSIEKDGTQAHEQIFQATKMTEDSSSKDIQKINDKLEAIDNKLERIKGDTHNLNRIASLSNAPLIIQELKKLIGRSEG